MYQQFYSGMAYWLLALGAFVFFFVFFIGVVARALSPRQQRVWKEVSQLPLADELAPREQNHHV